MLESCLSSSWCPPLGRMLWPRSDEVREATMAFMTRVAFGPKTD